MNDITIVQVIPNSLFKIVVVGLVILLLIILAWATLKLVDYISKRIVEHKNRKAPVHVIDEDMNSIYNFVGFEGELPE